MPLIALSPMEVIEVSLYLMPSFVGIKSFSDLLMSGGKILIPLRLHSAMNSPTFSWSLPFLVNIAE
jgi:hypothetical protein